VKSTKYFKEVKIKENSGFFTQKPLFFDLFIRMKWTKDPLVINTFNRRLYANKPSIVVAARSNAGMRSLRQNEYTELGWEVAYTHLKIKYLLEQGLIDQNTTIVTSPGREFLYNKVFKNVTNNYPLTKNGVLDLADELEFYSSHPASPNFMSFQGTDVKCLSVRDFGEDYDLRSTINLPTTSSKENYICAAYRQRTWGSHRNSDEHYINALRLLALTRKVYIVGLGAEKICDNKSLFYQPLDKWTALASDEKCQFVVGPATGPILLTWITSGKRIYLIDNEDCLSLPDCCLHFRPENNFYESKIARSFQTGEQLYDYILKNNNVI
jgi:hypothetical protein